ncbi:MAG: quinone-dependent dihydroorotate dehydrogenase, partial [Bacteroidales bacterium]|nr:quinone-dependent dihydroorotate dehydrogenase [Bacteroidales bacterium]
MYKQLIRPILFRFTPERIHDIIMLVFRFLSYIPLSKAFLSIFNNSNNNKLGKTLWNINFPHPVGLAAGLGKNAEAFEMFGSLGFSFIEIGTVTPKAQSGNSKPRLFRLPKSQALINRMGFNNEGVDKVVKRLKKHSSNLIIGGNIGKNKLTPNELAVDDYVFSFRALSEHVDYIAINISSPNTPGLRELQHKEELNT